MNDYVLQRLKLTVLLLMLGVIHVTAQNEMQRVSVNLKNASLTELFTLIEKQTSYRFSYRDVVIDKKENVTVEKNNVPAIVVLDAVLPSHGLQYSVVSEKSIVISKKETKKNASALGTIKHITGIVTDQTGFPVVGANVVEKGTTNGTMTDLDGKFMLDVVPGSIVQVSYIGYITREFKSTNESTFTVELKEDIEALEEVVVVGYGTQKKVNVIGSIAMVGSEKLENRATSSVTSALTG